MAKKTLVLSFIIFHLLSTAVWNLKVHVDIPEVIIEISKPYMYSLSLWQDWGVFSPNPYLKEISTRIVLEDYNSTYIYLPKYAKEGMPFFFDRFRKFNDNLISKKHTGLVNAYLVYACKEFIGMHKPEFTISLEIVYKGIPLPPAKAQRKESYEKIGEIVCA